MLSLDDIDSILQSAANPGLELVSQEWPSDDNADRERRAQALQGVFDTLQQLLYSGSSEAETVAQKLGDASRNRGPPLLLLRLF